MTKVVRPAALASMFATATADAGATTMATTISGDAIRVRREGLGLSRRVVCDVAELSLQVIRRIERGERCQPEQAEALIRALDEIEVELERQRRFLRVEYDPEPAPKLAPSLAKRVRPWPTSPMRALLDFRAAGAAAGADVVVVACSSPLHVVVGVSPLGIRVVSASTGCGLPADGFAHAIVLARDPGEAVETVALGPQVHRVLRGVELPPLRVLHRREDAIAGRRDNAGRIVLGVLPEPAPPPPAPVADTSRREVRKPPRRAPQEAVVAA